MKNELEVNFSASAVQALKRSMDMGMGCHLVIGLSGQVFVSGGGGVPQAIQDALDASANPAYFLDTSNNAQLGGIASGAAVTSITLDNTTTSDFVNLTWDQSSGLLDAASGRFTVVPNALYGLMDFYYVLETTDTQWMSHGVVGASSIFVGCAQNGQAIASTASVAIAATEVNGAVIGTTRDDFYVAASTGSKVIVAHRGINLGAAVWRDLGHRICGYGISDDFNLTGKIGDILMCNALSDTDSDAVIAALAARHGITLP